MIDRQDLNRLEITGGAGIDHLREKKTVKDIATEEEGVAEIEAQREGDDTDRIHRNIVGVVIGM
jgi:hypothetical protein